MKGYSQINVLEGKYTTFDNKIVDVYQIVGKYVVLNIGKSVITAEQLNDKITLEKILQRSDDLYAFYKDNLGFEPPGGNPLFGNKANIFWGTAGGGGGLGLVGAKGIEISGFYNIFYNLKYNLNVNRDVIIGYEFGRNFFTFSNKVLFPFDPNKDEKNGGFAEGFANILYLYAFDKIMVNPSQRELNETLLNIRWHLQRFRGYINDDSCTPHNTIAKWEKIGTLDPNRGQDGWNESDPAYTGTAILTGIIETFGKDNLFPKFFTILKDRPSVNTIEDALSNIAYSASFALNKNLLPFFKNVLKFKLNSNTESEIGALPPCESKLIRDESTLWFLSPFEEITLNLKSTNYLTDNCVYQIYIDGVKYSSNTDGKNQLKYSILGKENEKKITCQLLKNGSLIDSYDVLLKKRHNFNLFDFRKEFYAYYLSNAKTKSFFQADKLIMDGLEKDSLCESFIFYNLVFSRDREYKIEGAIRNVSNTYKLGDPLVNGFPTSGLSEFGFYGPIRNGGSNQRIGYDIGKGDTISYYKTYSGVNSNQYIPSDNRKYFMNRIFVKGVGYGQKTELQNFYFYDVTDTDNDGFVDFEDNCPTEPGKYQGCPQIQTSNNQLFNDGFTFYPNPTNDKLRISSAGEGVVLIHDLMGRLLIGKEIDNTYQEIDVSKFISGTYILQFTSKDRNQTAKFIKN